ncbi:MAG: S9 family peptidase, partial [Bacteroidetes bacterium]|nr:S9 family peptidase [Bacteroidota bacterium]
MKKTTLFLAAAISAFGVFAQSDKLPGNLVIEGIPEIPAQLKERMNQYQNTRSSSLSSFNPGNSSMMISTRFGETSQLHLVDHPGGARKQITFFKEPISGGSFCPLPERNGFIFSRDQGGNEFAQLYWFDLKSGSQELISDGGRTQNRLAAWSEKGDQFITISTRRTGKDYDLYLSHVDNPKEAKLILQEGGSWSVLDWSPDAKQLLVINRISANKSFIHILDIASGKLTQINPSKEDIAYSNGTWTADGKGIFIVNDEKTEFQTLKYYDIANKKFTSITASIPWDVSGVANNKDRSKFILNVNENGYSKLYDFNPINNIITPLEGLPIGIISGVRFNQQTGDLG